ncbi:hypothetical protein V8B97DRAFT_2021900 [Scleroderma yunnanense]
MGRQQDSLNKKPLIPESPGKRKIPSSENEVGKQAHLQAEKMWKAYDGHVGQGCKWLQSHTSSGSCIPTSIVEDIYNDPGFKDAFEKVPNHCSDKALALYLSWRGFHENWSWSTVEGVHMAFKKLDGDTYHKKWHYSEAQQCWKGNPATSAEVDDVMASIKHKVTMEGSDCVHLSAMKKEYMDKILTWSMTTCSELKSALHFISLVLTRTASASSWHGISNDMKKCVTWCFELVKLKQEDIQITDVTMVNHVLTKYLRGEQDTLVANERDVYYEIHLRNQKGWQKKVDKGFREIDLQSNCYKIYPQPDLTSCNSFFWLMVWVRWLEHVHLGWAMVDRDFIFPAIEVNDIVKPCKQLSQDTVQKWISEATTGTEIEGTFSTHCFFWWWGGWADSEHHDMLICYLLDELHCYENDHSDALGPFPCKADMSLAGKHTLATPATREDLQLLQSSVSMEIHNLDNSLQAILGNVTNSLQDLTQVVHLSQALSTTAGSLPPPSGTHSAPSFGSIIVVPLLLVPSTFMTEHAAVLVNLQSSAIHSSSTPVILALGTNHINQHHMFPQPLAISPSPATLESDTLTYSSPPPFIPDMPFTHPDGKITLQNEAWKDIIQHWEKGVQEKQLPPLRDWPYEFTHGPNHNLQSKYNQWCIITLEFLNQYKGDKKKFVKAYESAIQKGITTLLCTITAAHQKRGEAEI